jgi:hypothetical protein
MGYIDEDRYDSDDSDESNDEEVIIVSPYIRRIKVISEMILSNKYVISYVDSLDDTSKIKKIFSFFEKTSY